MIKRYLAYALGVGLIIDLIIDLIVGLAIGIAALLGVAKAETLVVGPDFCAAPADIDQIGTDLEIIAGDRNRWRQAADGVIIIYGPQEAGWASGRLTSRFIVDPNAGLDAPKPKIICVPDK